MFYPAQSKDTQQLLPDPFEAKEQSRLVTVQC
jgi:hypothetical protein